MCDVPARGGKGAFRMRMDDDFRNSSVRPAEPGCAISTVVTMLASDMIRERRMPF